MNYDLRLKLNSLSIWSIFLIIVLKCTQLIVCRILDEEHGPTLMPYYVPHTV